MREIKKLLVFFLILAGILGAPSVVYLIRNRTIDGYRGQNYYYIGQNDKLSTILGVIIFLIVIIGIFIVYFKLIKNSDKFKNIKTIILSVFIIGIIFLICLPNTSTDIFYYMGTGRLLSEYGINPYSQTVEETMVDITNDEILNNTGIWKDTTVIYGPIWVIITALLNKISFNSITILLYVFKVAALILHLINCVLIYKITKKKKIVIMYGFNPLILLEFLVNVHNDIYILTFVFLAIYFLKNKNNIWLTLLMLAVSVAIKHITLLLVPIFVLYYIKDKSMKQKILSLILYGTVFVLMTILMYLPFINNIMEVMKSALGQQNKIKDSIYAIIIIITNDVIVSSILYSIFLFIFFYFYIVICLKLLIEKNNFRNVMQKIYFMYAFLIFGVITNLTSWYLSWLFIPIFWIKSKDIKNILWLQLFYELTYAYLLCFHSDKYIYNMLVTPMIGIGMLVRYIYLKVKFKKKLEILGSNQ